MNQRYKRASLDITLNICGRPRPSFGQNEDTRLAYNC